MKDPSRPITIGFLASVFDDPFSSGPATGFREMTEKLGARIILYSYEQQQNQILKRTNQNVILGLIDSQSLDALIVSGFFSHGISPEHFRAFCESFRPIPVVTLGVKVPGIPGVVTDAEAGLRALMAHLLDVHRYQRIAFLGGPIGQQEAEQRKRVFIDEMDRRGLSVPEEWIDQGDFSFDSGARAMERLLDRGKPGFQGIVVANDAMALGAQRVLADHGWKVPGDFFMTGFDDFHAQKLTTVLQSSYLQLQAAEGLIFRMLNGEDITEAAMIPSSLVIRDSCGCRAGDRYLRLRLRQDEPAVERDTAWQERLELAFRASVADPRDGAFLNELQTILDENPTVDLEQVWHGIALRIRKNLFPELVRAELQETAGQVLDQGIFLMGDNALDRKSTLLNQVEERAIRLRGISEALGNSFGMDEVMDILARDLPGLGICACWLSLFDDPRRPETGSSLKLAFDQSGRQDLPPGGMAFRTAELRPGGIRTSGLEDWLMMAQVLYSKNELLGFVLYAVTREGSQVCNALRSPISGAIQGVKLWEEFKRAEKMMVQSEKMAALGALVAGVAHEINTPVGVGLTAASDLRMNAADIIGLYRANQLRRDQFEGFIGLLEEESALIERNLKRAGELIQSFKRIAVDQAHEETRRFRLESYLWDIVNSMGPQLHGGGHECRIECPADIELFGPPGSLTQIFGNLISNSLVHGFEGRQGGRIRIVCRANEGRLLIEYSDDGVGIPAGNIGKVFDPFFTTRMGHGSNGLGLHIVYNLVTQIWKGTVNCSSVSGEGACFRIDLPLDGRQAD